MFLVYHQSSSVICAIILKITVPFPGLWLTIQMALLGVRPTFAHSSKLPTCAFITFTSTYYLTLSINQFILYFSCILGVVNTTFRKFDGYFETDFGCPSFWSISLVHFVWCKDTNMPRKGLFEIFLRSWCTQSRSQLKPLVAAGFFMCDKANQIPFSGELRMWELFKCKRIRYWSKS